MVLQPTWFRKDGSERVRFSNLCVQTICNRTANVQLFDLYIIPLPAHWKCEEKPQNGHSLTFWGKLEENQMTQNFFPHFVWKNKTKTTTYWNSSFLSAFERHLERKQFFNVESRTFLNHRYYLLTKFELKNQTWYM